MTSLLELDTAGEEIKRLQSCVNDLMAVLALPAVWSGCEALEIVGTLLDGLLATLRLDFAYARLSDAADGAPVDVIRVARRDGVLRAEAVGQALRPVLAGDPPAGPLRVPNPVGLGEVTILSLQLGLVDDDRLVVGSQRPDFPTGIETLVLRVAANQAVIGLHEARLSREERRAARELQRRVAEGTEQLSVSQGLMARALDALRESETRIRAFCDNSPNLIFQKDRAGRYLYVNQEFQRAFGIDPRDVIGKTDADLFSPEQAAAFQTNDRRVMDAGAPMEFEEMAQHADGWHAGIVHRFPLVDAEGRLYAVGGIVTDITDRKRISEEVDGLRKQLELENAYLHEKVREEFAFGEIVGQSRALQEVLQQIQMVAPTDAAVMITGESGTGKELVARAIHDRSPRRDRAMVTVNCASVPRDLFESEFFGHVRGSFTGAIRDRTGRFQLADKSTLFLDEVGEIPLELQGKLLRVLQGGHVQRVGEDQVRQVDVRVIAATNRDAREELAAGRFRRDLYYRLCVFPIHLPPLRGRHEDIRLLAAHFLDLARRQLKRPDVRLTNHALGLLERYDWPGNVRELSNVIERAVILSEGGPLRIDLVLGESPPASAAPVSPSSPILPGAERAVRSQLELNRQERDNVLAALETAQWRIYGPGGAAHLLGLKPTTLASRLKRLGIARPGQHPAS
jgi:PAS domain S-box-containing protein